MTDLHLVPDNFDFNKYLSAPTDDYKLDRPAQYEREVIDMFYGETKNEGALLPFPKTHNLIRFRPNEVTIWSGINGHGKSQLTSQVALDFAWNQGERVAIASMEMLPRRTLWRMSRQAFGDSEPSIRYIKQFLPHLNQRLWLLNRTQVVSPALILGVIRYSAAIHHINHFFIDSLMMCGLSEDDYPGQQMFVGHLCAVAKEFPKLHIHLIHHVRKMEDERRIPGKFDSKGSGGISDKADNFLTVWRDIQKENALKANPTDANWIKRPDTIINIDKQRNGEWQGHIHLWFDGPSMTFKGLPTDNVRQYQTELQNVLHTSDAGTEVGAKCVSA